VEDIRRIGMDETVHDTALGSTASTRGDLTTLPLLVLLTALG